MQHTLTRTAAFVALVGLAGSAFAQEREAKTPPERLDRNAILRDGKDAGGDAFQRLYETPAGPRGVASTAPIFDPATGLASDSTLVETATGFASYQGGLTVEIAPSTVGRPSAMVFADGQRLLVSPSVRLHAQAEQGDRFQLVTRAVNGARAEGNAVHFASALESAELRHIAHAGGITTELLLRSLPEPLVHGTGYQIVWFEETIDLPRGWWIEGLERGTGALRATAGVWIRDTHGNRRARLEAPRVYERDTAKAAASHSAPVFAELVQQAEGVVSYKVGIPAAWLSDSARSWPVVIDPVITEGTPVTITADSTVDITARQVFWNAVGVTSSAGDWDLFWGNAISWNFDPDCDFVIANGNRGVVTPESGDALLFSGSGPATLEHAAIDGMVQPGTETIQWGADQALHLVEVLVTATGPDQVTVNAPAGLRFAMFQPGTTADWLARDDAFFEGDTNVAHTIDFVETGFWALVVFKDNGPGATGTVTIDVGAPAQTTPFNLTATSLSLDGSAFPANQIAGDIIQFTRNIARTGTLPTGAQIDYGVYLSTDTVIDTTDFELWSFQGAGTGSLQLNGFIPATIPDGTYFVGMRIEVVTGETDVTDNQVHDAVTDHVVVIGTATPPPPTALTLVPGTQATASITPQAFEATPNGGIWNLIAVNGDDWDVTVGAVTSNKAAPATDFLVFDGNVGPLPTTITGTLERKSGTADATALHTASTLIGSSGTKTFTWAQDRIAHIFAHEVLTTGDYTLDVTGINGLNVFVFAPGTTADPRPRNQAFAESTSGTQLALTFAQPGFHAIVVVKDGAPQAAGTIDLSIQPVVVLPPPPSFNTAADAIAITGTGSTSVSVAHGDSVTFDRAIAVTGTLPQGAQVDYTIWLSLDQVIDATDIAIHTFSGAAAGQATVTETVTSSTIPAGLYFVALDVDAPAGEVDTTDNLKFATRQLEVTSVIAPPPPPPATYNLAVTTAAIQSAAQSNPIPMSTGDTVTVDLDLVVTGTLPQGSSINYDVILSTDQVIDANDVTIGSRSGQAAGSQVFAEAIPASTQPDTYFLAVVAAPVAGETNAADNTRFATLQIEVTPPIGLLINAIPVDVRSTNGAITIGLGDSFDVEVDSMITSAPITTPATWKLYLSTNNIISTFDEEVGSGSGLGPQSATATLNANSTIASGVYFLGVIIDPVAGETNLNDNDLPALVAEVTVNGFVAPPPPINLTLTPGQPATVTSSLTFGFSPAQGLWNGIAVVANDPADDWDVRVGGGNSARFNPDTDFVVSNGHMGTITETFGDVTQFFATQDGTIVHQIAQPLTFNQNATLNWAQGQVLLLTELDVQQAGAIDLVIDGPAGMKAAIFEPGFAGFDSRSFATQSFDLSPVPQQVDFFSAGVWAIAFFHDADVAVGDSTITLDWTPPPAPAGFDLAAARSSIPAGLTLQPGDVLDVTRLIANLGQQDSPQYVYAVYVSPDQTIDPAADFKIFESQVQNPLLAGTTNQGTAQVMIPQNVPNGTFHVGIFVPQLANDAETSNAAAASVETVDVSGGSGGTIASGSTSGPNARRSSSGGGGGGCSVTPGSPSSNSWPVLFVLFGLVAVRTRRRA